MFGTLNGAILRAQIERKFFSTTTTSRVQAKYVRNIVALVIIVEFLCVLI